MNDPHPVQHGRSSRLGPAVLTAAIAVAALLSGCSATGSASTGSASTGSGSTGSPSPSAGGAAQVAESFSAAVAAGRGTEACELLVPAAQKDAAAASGADCATGVLSLGLPAAGSVLSEQAYGRASFVELEHDTVFLAVSGSTWRVRAAGCVEQGEAPYDCRLEGD